jgi:hypothetical protein
MVTTREEIQGWFCGDQLIIEVLCSQNLNITIVNDDYFARNEDKNLDYKYSYTILQYSVERLQGVLWSILDIHV